MHPSIAQNKLKKKKKGFLLVGGSEGAHLVHEQQQAPSHREQTPYESTAERLPLSEAVITLAC